MEATAKEHVRDLNARTAQMRLEGDVELQRLTEVKLPKFLHVEIVKQAREKFSKVSSPLYRVHKITNIELTIAKSYMLY